MYIINIIKASFWENLNFQNSLPFMNILYFDGTFAIMNNV